MDDFRNELKKFINREYEAQDRQLKDMWGKSVNQRVSEGEAIRDIELTRVIGNQAQLRCRENISKFRKGDYLLLNQGNPLSGGYKCIVHNDNGLELNVIAGYGTSFNSLQSGNGWVLDRDTVDLRGILLGVIDSLQISNPRTDRIIGMIKQEIIPSANLSRESLGAKLIDNINMNESQKNAFIKAFATENFHMIQGPPGTGKTWLLAYLATALAQEGERVLVTAFTHRAINNALRKISQTTGYRNLLKVGQFYHTDDLTWTNGSVHNYGRFENSPFSESSKGIIVGGTCFSLRTSRLGDISFDTVIFDEAGQVTLPLAISGMLSGKKYIFIGDHKQMAPVIVAEHENKWVSKYIFETVFNPEYGVMLDTTYRMCSEINQFPSEQFYKGKLKPAEEIKVRRLNLSRKPMRFASILNPEEPNIFVELSHMNNGMRSEEEADLAAGIAAEAINCGILHEDIAIISPYRAQGRLIRSKLSSLSKQYTVNGLSEIIVDTVERIQGQERNIIIISLTTSDPSHASQRAEFYFQPNRLNVAITRAKVKRIVIGNPVLFQAQPTDHKMSKWIENFRDLYNQSYIIKM